MAEDFCMKLSNHRAFQDCHLFVDPEPFFENCMHDLCACKGGNVNECACPVLAHYASECSRQGINLNWLYQVAECGEYFSSHLKCKCIESLIYFSSTLPYV